MTIQVTLDWKSFAALGATAIGLYLVSRIDREQSAKVLTTAASALSNVNFIVNDK